MRTYQPPDYRAFRQRVARRQPFDRLATIVLWAALTIGGALAFRPAVTHCAASAHTTEARP